MYRNIKTLIFNYICNESHSGFISETIDELIFNIPLLSNRWLPVLTGLRHFSLGHQVTMTASTFSRLLENISNLRSLTTDVGTLKHLTDNWSNIVVYNYVQNIRKLNLDPKRDLHLNFKEHIKSKDLQNVVRIFGRNCEHLTLCLESHHVIETLVLPFMQKLHSLNVSGVFDRLGRIFVMNSIEQWQTSRENIDY
jgi:hypothetical protein